MIPIIFQAFQNHHVEQHTSEVWNNAFIGLKISAKFSYRVNTDNRKNWHLSADTNMVANILFIPSKCFSFTFFKSFMYRWQHCLNDPHSFGSSKTTETLYYACQTSRWQCHFVKKPCAYRAGELWRHSVGVSAVSMKLVPSTKSQ